MQRHAVLVSIGFESLVVVFLVSLLAVALRPKMWHAVVSLFSGMLAGFIGMFGDDPQLPLLMVLFFSTMLGFARNDRPWLWGIVCGMGIPLFEIFREAVSMGGASLNGVAPTLLGAVGGLVGAYLGAGLSAVTQRAQKADSTSTPTS